MKRIGDKPLTQVEMNKRYREKYNLATFSVKISKDLYEDLRNKLESDNLSNKDFLIKAIDWYLKGK